MNTNILYSSFLLSFALAACGGAVGGEGAPVADKGQAAQAAYRTQQTGEDVQNRKSQGLTAAQVTDIPGIDQDGIGTSTEYTVDGAEGSAKVTVETSVTSGDVQASYTVEYDRYSSNGVDFIDGRMAYTSRVITGGDGVDVSHQMKGSVVIWGTQAADLEVDATLSVVVGGGSGAVSVRMDGTITADGESFSYDGDAFDVEGGAF